MLLSSFGKAWHEHRRMYANTMTITLDHLSIATMLIEDLVTSWIPSRGLPISERASVQL